VRAGNVSVLQSVISPPPRPKFITAAKKPGDLDLLWELDLDVSSREVGGTSGEEVMARGVCCGGPGDGVWASVTASALGVGEPGKRPEGHAERQVESRSKLLSCTSLSESAAGRGTQLTGTLVGS